MLVKVYEKPYVEELAVEESDVCGWNVRNSRAQEFTFFKAYTRKTRTELLEKYALFVYAGQYWHSHARKAKVFSNSIEDILNNLILQKEKHGADLFAFVRNIC